MHEHLHILRSAIVYTSKLFVVVLESAFSPLVRKSRLNLKDTSLICHRFERYWDVEAYITDGSGGSTPLELEESKWSRVEAVKWEATLVLGSGCDLLVELIIRDERVVGVALRQVTELILDTLPNILYKLWSSYGNISGSQNIVSCSDGIRGIVPWGIWGFLEVAHS